jgi:hypothetical protein
MKSGLILAEMLVPASGASTERGANQYADRNLGMRLH